jgi:hypothetical protein
VLGSFMLKTAQEVVVVGVFHCELQWRIQVEEVERQLRGSAVGSSTLSAQHEPHMRVGSACRLQSCMH